VGGPFKKELRESKIAQGGEIEVIEFYVAVFFPEKNE
jgi:hypothetical protein